STFVPVMSVWLLRSHRGGTEDTERKQNAFFSSLRVLRASVVKLSVRLRWLVVPAYVAAAAALIWFAGRPLGTEIFPTVDAGQFQMRLRAPTGTRIERTEQLVIQALDGIAEEAGGKDNVAISLGWLGVVPSSYPINAVYLFTG